MNMFKLILKIFRLKKTMDQIYETCKILDINQKNVYKKVSKFEKNMEKIEIELSNLKKSNDLDVRVSIIESFFDNIEKITDDYEKNVAN